MTNASVLYPRRVRNDLRFRALRVSRCEEMTPAFRRIIFSGPALEGFSSRGFDDHTKVFFPINGEPLVAPEVTDEGIVWQSDVRPPSRDYTPLFDEQRQELALDFYLHDGGIASEWAKHAQVGDSLMIGGPRGSLVVPTRYHWQLYICDETGLPALRRRLEMIAASGDRPVIKALVRITDSATKAYLGDLAPMADIQWLVDGDEAEVAQWLAQQTVPEQDYFVWITGEGKSVKRLAAPLEETLDPQLLRAAAYWHDKPE